LGSAVASSTADAVTLTVTRTGGDGRVISSPPGIDCGPASTQCAAEFAAGRYLILRSTAWDDVAWIENDECSGRGECVFTLDGPTTITARFDHHLNVSVVQPSGSSGYGWGIVQATTGHINCSPASPSQCTKHYPPGTEVTLFPNTESPSTFGGWGGACSGTGNCVVTMDGTRNVTATFNLEDGRAVVRVDSPHGLVSSNPSGIDCPPGADPAVCSHLFPLTSPPTNVTFTASTRAASAAQGIHFVKWEGPCLEPTSAACTLSMDRGRRIKAQWGADVNVTYVSAEGSGVVQESEPGGIACGSSGTKCQRTYPVGQQVLLRAVYAAPTYVDGTSWTAPCDTTHSEWPKACSFTVEGETNVTVRFKGNNPSLAVNAYQGGTVNSVNADGTPDGLIACSQGCESSGCCSHQYPYGQSVRLKATGITALGTNFSRWMDGPENTNAERSVVVDGLVNPVPRFEVPLTVNKVGSGNGRVSLNSNYARMPGNNYQNGCVPGFVGAMDYLSTQSFSAWATADSGSRVASWSGDCLEGWGANCPLAPDRARTVTVDLRESTTLTLNLEGAGGEVHVTPGDYRCFAGQTCHVLLDKGQPAALTWSAYGRGVFTGWGGDCESAGTAATCELDALATENNLTVGGTFKLPLEVVKGGDGSGAVTSVPSGINCGTQCANAIASSTVTLQAAPDVLPSKLDDWEACGLCDVHQPAWRGRGAA